MKKITISVAIAVMLSCQLSVTANAQNQGSPSVETVSPAKAKAIRRLLELMGSEKLAQQILSQLLPMIKRSAPQVPDSVWADIENEFSSDVTSGKLMEVIIPIYSRQFSEEDVKGLIAFYESPLGKKMAAALPKIASESFTAGQQWGFDVLERIRGRLKEKGYSVSTD
ncbi:MAG TPA: DUF2059 domain-containing protein [Blastocatellia bacterium]|nr:DUF2059 domain-containing protein [Blastocatellia bacterium]